MFLTVYYGLNKGEERVRKLKKFFYALAMIGCAPGLVSADVLTSGAWAYERSKSDITGHVGEYVFLAYQCSQRSGEVLAIVPDLTRILPSDPNSTLVNNPYFVAAAVNGGEYVEVPYTVGEGLIDISRFIPSMPEQGFVFVQINNKIFRWQVDGFSGLREECNYNDEWEAVIKKDLFSGDKSMEYSINASRTETATKAELTLVCNEYEYSPSIKLNLGIGVSDSFVLRYRFDDNDPINSVQSFNQFDVVPVRDHFLLYDIGGLLAAKSLRVQFGSSYFAEWNWTSLPNEFLSCVQSFCAREPQLCEPQRPLNFIK